MINEDDLNSFLKFGYFQSYDKRNYEVDLGNIDKNFYKEYTENELMKLGIDLFREAVANEYNPNKQHVIPLSGGLDSRALLAGLLECTSADNIHTYTFGIPGALDFEIGNYVARKIGTKHQSFSLQKHHYSQKELLDISKRMNLQTMLFHHPPVWKIDEYYKDFIFWSGYVGDIVVGGHLPQVPAMDIEEAKKNYVHKKGYTKSIKLHNCDEQDFIDNINFPFISAKKLSYEEQITFKERNVKWTAPHVLMDGYEYKTPFINNQWMNFMLSIDNKYRKDENLFIKIMLYYYPELFNLKTKTNYGLSLNASTVRVLSKRVVNKLKHKVTPFITSKNINYLDFDKAFRNRKDLKEIIKNNLYDLKMRNIITWLDIEEIYNNHMNKKGNYSDALIILVSLEIHLKNMEPL